MRCRDIEKPFQVELTHQWVGPDNTLFLWSTIFDRAAKVIGYRLFKIPDNLLKKKTKGGQAMLDF